MTIKVYCRNNILDFLFTSVASLLILPIQHLDHILNVHAVKKDLWKSDDLINTSALIPDRQRIIFEISSLSQYTL